MIVSDNFRITAPELEAALSGRRITDQAKEIAKAILVDGRSAIETANDFGVTRGRVYQIRDQAMAAYLAASSFPADWRRVTIIASPELIEEIISRAEQERQDWLSDKQPRPQKTGPAPRAGATKTKATSSAAEKKSTAKKTAFKKTK